MVMYEGKLEVFNEKNKTKIGGGEDQDLREKIGVKFYC